MKYAVLFDFGSTFTKAAVIRKEDAAVMCTAKRPSTVKSDASVAMEQCLDDIKARLGEKIVDEAEIHAASSAAGGLRIAVIGLTERLSIAAGKNVAFGAGAKIVSVKAGRLTESDVKELGSTAIEMILFCGGYENGNTSVLLHNAKMLAESGISCPIIYGGNSAVAKEIRQILLMGGRECFLIPNIIPQVGEFQTADGEEIIRNLFMKRIVNMKGLSGVRKVVGNDILPTPKAVLDAGYVLAAGSGDGDGIGPLMIVDIGGATTDIHSYAESYAGGGARMIGAVQPYAKRTVEGDLGMRESSDALLRTADLGKLAIRAGITENELSDGIRRRVAHTEIIPKTQKEEQIDFAIAAYAAKEAARRHAGHIEFVSGSSCNKIQIGKNLTDIRCIVGTGGPIINSKNPERILSEACKKGEGDDFVLLPKNAQFLVDTDYILYAAGLLAQYDKKLALAVMKKSLNIW